MPEMHLRLPGFTYSACGPFTKNKKRIQKFMQTGYTNYIYKNELDKACFQHDTAYGKYKDLEKKTQSDKVLKNKTFEIANNAKYAEYKRGLAFISFLTKNQKELVLNKINNYLLNFINRLLGNEKKKECFSFKDNIWGVDLADMQLISKHNKGIRYLLCAIDLFSKYAFVVPLKNKKETTIVNAFQSILNNSKRKPNKIWIDQVSEFYNTHFKKRLRDDNIKMYSTHKEGKSVVDETLIKTLKIKIY